jgi:hypothetical protein
MGTDWAEAPNNVWTMNQALQTLDAELHAALPKGDWQRVLDLSEKVLQVAGRDPHESNLSGELLWRAVFAKLSACILHLNRIDEGIQTIQAVLSYIQNDATALASVLYVLLPPDRQPVDMALVKRVAERLQELASPAHGESWAWFFALPLSAYYRLSGDLIRANELQEVARSTIPPHFLEEYGGYFQSQPKKPAALSAERE